MRAAELEGGTIVLPKRISLAIAAAFLIQFGWLIYHYATNQAAANGRIERLERDVAVVSLVNDRTIRIEAKLGYIEGALERMAKR